MTSRVGGKPRVCVSLCRSWAYALGWHWLTYRRLIRRAGGDPLYVKSPRDSAVDAEVAASRALEGCQALVLGGGEHVAPGLYDMDQSAEAGASLRDSFELALVRQALKSGRPILGICRGSQLVNVALGGTLTMIKAPRAARRGRSYGLHPVAVSQRSRLGKILGRRRLKCVLSLNRQAVAIPGRGLRIVARAADRTPMAIELTGPQYPPSWCLGVQWHPDLFPVPHIDQKMIESLVTAAAHRTAHPRGKDKHKMPEDLVTIYTAMDEIQAEVVKAVLDAEGIPSFIANENQAMLAGCIPVNLQVRSSDVERAKAFIADHEQASGSDQASATDGEG